MRKTTKVVALDIHKESTTVAVAGSSALRFCYEAGPCGYGVYRQLTAMGHECTVVAPSLIPRRPGDRIKTDRRDALALARLRRNGELTAVWVPDQEQEAMRDLERCREDMTHSERRVRQRLNSFLQRHSRIFSGRSRWTQAHFRWLETQRFDHPFQQIVFQEYVDAVQQAQARVKGTGQGTAAGAGGLVAGAGDARYDGPARGGHPHRRDDHGGVGRYHAL